MKRLIFAVVVAPLWAPLIVEPYAWFNWPVQKIFPELGRFEWMEAVFSVLAGSGYFVMIVVGLPLHAVLRRKGYGALKMYLLGWFVFALIVWACVFLFAFAQYGMAFASGYLTETIVQRPWVPLSSGLTAMLIGATFWLIVKPLRRPQDGSSSRT